MLYVTVRELEEKLKTLPADLLIVVPGSDHSYRRVDCALVGNAGKIRDYIGEWWDEEHAQEGEEKIEVLVIT